ncbi:hypothetical protein ACFPOE_01695 [Caenimonas terrae]|uniref:Uncharacterized protein n=1 Tax=Caenimonas terrae TaxID=696074 RepID=A0ABW0N6C5_9BURK
MSATTKVVGLIAGLSAVAAIGVAVAQGVPPNPYIANPALGAGQQSTHMTSMGETGVPGLTDTVRTATIVRQQEVAVAPAPVMAQPAPAPVVAAQTETTTTATTMGAAPEPAPAPVRIARAARRDRN